MATAYDVIIIGTGAGGGTLRVHGWRRRASASCFSSAATDVPAREARTGIPTPSSWKDRYSIEDAVVRPRRPGVSPGTHYFVGGNTKFYGAALLRLRAGGLRRGPAPRRHVARLADRLRGPRAYYTQAEHLYQVHGQRGTDPTEPPASAPYRYPAGDATSRGSSSSSDDLTRLGLQAVPRCRSASCATSRSRRRSRVHSLRHL